jgi:putative ABC transport system ATP-binding protein
MAALCEIQHVSKDYGSGESKVRALSDVHLTIGAGEFTVFSGPSGSGKTTLLNLVGLLDAPSDGKVLLEGVDTAALSARELAALRAKRIGFIFQSFNLIPVLTALENVELALQLAGRPAGGSEAKDMLGAVGLGDYLHRRPGQLSGGQQQRVAVARALVKRPALVIADEPTANLDSASGGTVLDIMRDLNQSLGVTFVFSTHDARVLERARRVLTLVDGRVTHDDVRGGG